MQRDRQNLQHFCITQLLVVCIALLTTGLMQLASSQTIYLFYFFPILLILMVIYYFIFWKREEDDTDLLLIINSIVFIISCPVFFGIHFGIFNLVQKYDFERVESCQVIGQLSVNLSGNERYSILYIDYNQAGSKYLGYGCLSDNYRASTVENIFPYNFYENGDSFRCGPTKKGDSYDLTKKRVLTRERQVRNLKIRSSLRTSSGSRGCTQKYSFSEVKLASWMCLQRTITFEELTKQQVCYVAAYNHDYQSSKTNSLTREILKEQRVFMMVNFDLFIYYPKVGYIMNIVFAYFPFLISFNVVCIFIAQCLINSYCGNNRAVINLNNESSLQQCEISNLQNIQNLQNDSSSVRYDDAPAASNDKKSLQNETQSVNKKDHILQLKYFKNQTYNFSQQPQQYL